MKYLPNLSNNIKCGNSLIASDFYESKDSLFDKETLRLINAFDWVGSNGFKKIMDEGGFDCVIGNPPWGSFISEEEKKYLIKKFKNKKGEAESHLYFIEKGMILLNQSGLLGYITPNTWLTVINSAEIRNYLLQNYSIKHIRELSKYIFKDAPDIVPILVFISKDKSNKTCDAQLSTEIKIQESNFKLSFISNKINQETWLNSNMSIINLRLSKSVKSILNKCNEIKNHLIDLTDILYGIKTGDNEKYLSFQPFENNCVKALKTGEIKRYYLEWKGLYLKWNPNLAGYRQTPVDIPKIIIQYIRKISMPRRIIAALDEDGVYYPLNNYSYVILKPNQVFSLKYILGILNSNLINYYFSNTFIDYNIKPTYLQLLPIVNIDLNDKILLNTYSTIISLVDQMIATQKSLQIAQIEQDKVLLNQQFEILNKKIDKLVYELYGLTEEEIKVVEGE